MLPGPRGQVVVEPLSARLVQGQEGLVDRAVVGPEGLDELVGGAEPEDELGRPPGRQTRTSSAA
jgi:hypothetical protein